MSWLSTAIIVVVGILYLMTLITSPGITIEFSKEMLKSGGKLFEKLVKFIKDVKTKEKIEEVGKYE